MNRREVGARLAQRDAGVTPFIATFRSPPLAQGLLLVIGTGLTVRIGVHNIDSGLVHSKIGYASPELLEYRIKELTEFVGMECSTISIMGTASVSRRKHVKEDVTQRPASG